jgi:threonine aldolase
MMISFRNDYSEGAHPLVLEALTQTNLESTPGYGCDAHCERAAAMIRSRFACPDADVHFLTGGTVTNLAAIAAFLRPWEAAIAASTGHIGVHESGAIEGSGHKVCTIPAPNGKLTPALIREVAAAHQGGDDGHMVDPRLVYLSDSTELGTVYQKSELEAISQTCRELGLYLYLDGARMAAALACKENDLAPEDFARLCDAFYIGGTKDGLLFGEALVIANPLLKPHFRNVMKQRGGMMAKGRLLGVQFEAFLKNDLWLDMARHADEEALRIAKALADKGYSLLAPACTNQLFPILTNEKIAELGRSFCFELSDKIDGAHTAVRFVTSWATRDKDVDALIAAL